MKTQDGACKGARRFPRRDTLAETLLMSQKLIPKPRLSKSSNSFDSSSDERSAPPMKRLRDELSVVFDSEAERSESSTTSLEAHKQSNIEVLVPPSLENRYGRITKRPRLTPFVEVYPQTRTKSIYHDRAHDTSSFSSLPEIDIINSFYPSEADVRKPFLYKRTDTKELLLDMDNFTIYNDEGRLCDAADVHIGLRVHHLYIDGVVSKDDHGSIRPESSSIAFKKLSIAGYFDGSSDPVEIYVCSLTAASSGGEVWYKLKSPAKEYARFWRHFLWRATLAKHFIEFMDEYPDSLLPDFRFGFAEWLNAKGAENIVPWMRQMRNNDFRHAICAHATFLYNEAYNLGDTNVHRCRIFRDILWQNDEMSYDKTSRSHETPRHEGLKNTIQLNIAKADADSDVIATADGVIDAVTGEKIYEEKKMKHSCSVEPTIVTTNVERWFGKLFPSGLLESVDDSPTSVDVVKMNPFSSLTTPLDSAQNDSETSTPVSIASDAEDEICFSDAVDGKKYTYRSVQINGVEYQVGDVVELDVDFGDAPKNAEQGWREGTFCIITEFLDYVTPAMRLVWLYTTSQTSLNGSPYQDPRELYYSTHCECEQNKGETPLDSIKRKVTVKFGHDGRLDPEAGYYVRYKYHLDGTFEEFGQHMFYTGQQRLLCECGDDEVDEYAEFCKKYKVGNTILVEPTESKKEVMLFVIYTIIDMTRRKVKLRLWYRARDFFKGAAINEVVMTDQYLVGFSDFESVARTAHIEYVVTGSDLPVNLQHNGAGDHMFFSRRFDNGPISDELKAQFPPLHQSSSQLKLLDLFCGGGNFGHGLEDAGACKVRWGIDRDHAVLHTYRANHGPDVEIVHRSVNDVMRDAISDRLPSGHPKVGEVDIIAAGSPCQGFSKMSSVRDSPDALAKNSMVTSVASFLDVYRPKYLLLENVPDLMSSILFKHLLSFMVRIGYQVRYKLIGAWNHGCAQSRTRAFLWAVKLGESLPEHSYASHSDHNKRQFSTFVLPSGKRHASRELAGTTTFRQITIEDAIGDLPNIADGSVEDCILWPDHREATKQYSRNREMMSRIPYFPPEQGYLDLLKKGGVPDHLRLRSGGKLVEVQGAKLRWFRRIRKDGLLPTIVTSINPVSHHPQWVHYDQPRMVTTREAMRGQGFLDSDVLVGRRAVQMLVCGNSVARPVAFALGLRLRDAVEKAERTLLQDVCIVEKADVDMPLFDEACIITKDDKMVVDSSFNPISAALKVAANIAAAIRPRSPATECISDTALTEIKTKADMPTNYILDVLNRVHRADEA